MNTQSFLDKFPIYSTTPLATGTQDEAAAQQLFSQLLSALPADMKTPYDVNAWQAILHQLAPKDALEGMLIIQMLVLQAKGTELMGMGYNVLMPEISDARLKHATQLFGMFGKHLDRLHNYRRKGKQTIQVQHVHVNDGGQAIVGTLHNEHEGG